MDAATEEVDSLDALQHQNHSLLLDLAEDLKCYLTLLSGFLEQQAAFVLDQKVQTQKVAHLLPCETLLSIHETVIVREVIHYAASLYLDVSLQNIAILIHDTSLKQW